MSNKTIVIIFEKIYARKYPLIPLCITARNKILNKAIVKVCNILPAEYKASCSLPLK